MFQSSEHPPVRGKTCQNVCGIVGCIDKKKLFMTFKRVPNGSVFFPLVANTMVVTLGQHYHVEKPAVILYRTLTYSSRVYFLLVTCSGTLIHS